LEQQNLALRNSTDRSYSICAKTNSSSAAQLMTTSFLKIPDAVVNEEGQKSQQTKEITKEEVKPAKKRKSQPSKALQMHYPA
jgi:hypothetical protein